MSATSQLDVRECFEQDPRKFRESHWTSPPVSGHAWPEKSPILRCFTAFYFGTEKWTFELGLPKLASLAASVPKSCDFRICVCYFATDNCNFRPRIADVRLSKTLVSPTVKTNQSAGRLPSRRKNKSLASAMTWARQFPCLVKTSTWDHWLVK